MPSRRFPLQFALGALLVYGLTLGWGITTNSLPLAAKVAGWDWRPMAGQPLLWLLTLPLHCLPAGWIPFVLNLFSAGCGALVLGVLARSTALLIWNRPLNPVEGWSRHLPLLLAGAVCGLEFNFWQEATAGSGEMLDLLLLASAIWCLLEYRASKESRWLNAAALVWGLGLAENWVMLVWLPLLLVALIRLRRARFLRGTFLVRMTLLGLAGFSVYLLLPLVNGLFPHSPWSFSEAWVVTLKTTRHTFGLLYNRFWVSHRLIAISVAVFFLVPTLPCLLRLSDENTRNKSKVDRLQIWLYRALRAALLLACLWLAFDPAVGPRQIIWQQTGMALPLLTFDYLNALGAGFMAGSLMLMLSASGERRRRHDPFRRFRQFAAPGVFLLLLVVVTGGLLLRNAPAITLANRQPLAGFGALAVRSLPPGGGVVLSDDLEKLLVFQAALAHSRAASDWLAVDTLSLPSPAYRAALERRRPSGWLTAETRHELKPSEISQLLGRVARGRRIFYLHPSFGYFFERFYLEPQDAIFELKLCDGDHLGAPPLPPAAAEQNGKFWDETWSSELAAISRTLAPPPIGRLNFGGRILRHLHVGAVPPRQSRLLGEWFSVALNTWGVELQRAGRLPAACRLFEQAQSLNTNNLAALVNRQNNTNLQAGAHLNLAGLNQVAGWFRDPKQLGLVMSKCGPFDDPVICYLLGSSFQQRGELRQAAQQFERCRTLAVGAVAPDLALGEIYSRWRMDDKVFEIVHRLRATARKLPADNPLEVQLSLLEAGAWLSQTNLVQARGVLQTLLQQHPADDRVLNLVVKAFMNFGDYTNAQQLLSGRLARDPDNVMLLNNQAAIFLQLGDATNARPLLDRVLVLTNMTTARFNRAVAGLELADLPAAEADYLSLERAGADPFRVHLGLAEIANRRHDTNRVIEHLTICLTNLPAGSPAWRQLRERLDSLTHPPAVKR